MMMLLLIYNCDRNSGGVVLENKKKNALICLTRFSFLTFPSLANNCQFWSFISDFWLIIIACWRGEHVPPPCPSHSKWRRPTSFSCGTCPPMERRRWNRKQKYIKNHDTHTHTHDIKSRISVAINNYYYT